MKALSSILVLSVLVASVAIGAPLKLEKSIPLPSVKGGFDYMAVDVGGRRLFLCAEDNGTVEVLDLAGAKRIRSLPGFHEPKWAVYRPEQQRLYVSQGNGTVSVLNPLTFTRKGEYHFNEKANNLRFDPATHELFVGIGKTFGAVAVVDTVKNAKIAEIRLADFPKQFEIVGQRIYVNVPKANHIAVIDRTKGKVVAIWPVLHGKENVPMGIDRSRHRLFVGCDDGKLIVFNTDTGRSVAQLDIPVGADGVHYDAKRRQIYVSSGSGELQVLAQQDADHYALAGRLRTGKGAGTSWYSPEFDRLYVPVPAHGERPAKLEIFRPTPLK